MRRVISLLFAFAVSTSLFSQGYEIKIKVPAFKDSKVILAHFFAREGSFYPDDTVILDKNGVGVFNSPKPLAGGMYIAYLPNSRYFDFIIGDHQKFSMEADTTNLATGVKFQESLENSLYYEYRNLTNLGFETEQKWKTAAGTQKDSLGEVMKSINQRISTFVEKNTKGNPKAYFSVWIKSLRDVEVPDFPRDPSGKVLDSAFRYNYWHHHYFDNFNLADSRLIRTPFYEKKLKHYIEKVIPQHLDSIKQELDFIMNRVKGNEEITRYCLGFLFNHYATLANQIVGMDAIYVYFSEKYYLPHATWIDNDFKEKLIKTIGRVKPNLIGNPAPPISLLEVTVDHFIAAQKDTSVKSSLKMGSPLPLERIVSDYTVMVFWSIDCGHCQKDIPLLNDSIFPKLAKMGVKLLAIHNISSVDEKGKWIDFVNQHKLYGWINAVPYNADYQELYKVFVKPTIYVLDGQKRIIAKNIGIRQIEEVIEHEEKAGKK
jgi:thiol-disulfide isomerase/thioredoxin